MCQGVSNTVEPHKVGANDGEPGAPAFAGCFAKNPFWAGDRDLGSNPPVMVLKSQGKTLEMFLGKQGASIQVGDPETDRELRETETMDTRTKTDTAMPPALARASGSPKSNYGRSLLGLGGQAPLRDLKTISRLHQDLAFKKKSSTSPLSSLRGQMLFHTEAGTRLVSLEDRA